ncbi:DEAD-box ATP-dependent RNA helicase [Rhizophlyctis rosea]|uniref:RNA helicase n=1 Tax=Rhizophlyctis rosea TaxID=64517 RepID=A0AAD5SAL8_9FUNG|nr:DEAD-box ATP-dependent RNA helicase [Rhizophlyctis rosea]
MTDGHWDTPGEGEAQVNGADARAEEGATEVSDEEAMPSKPFYAMAKRWQEGEADEDLETELYGDVNLIDVEQFESIAVKVYGEDQPEAMKSFEDYPWHETLKANIGLMKYKSPMPIQQYGIPVLLAGRDLMGCAQTGSGKTAAYVLPILQKMLKKGKDKLRGGPELLQGRGVTATPFAVVLAPTRELCAQIFDDIRKFAYRTWVRPFALYGGVKTRETMDFLDQHGCDFLVATPGRLKDMLQRKKISFAKVKFLVIDEADRMLDMGFEADIEELIKRTDMPQDESRQTAMFSATFPKDVRRLGREYLGDLILLTVGTVGKIPASLHQQILFVEDGEKRDKLLELLWGQEAQLTLIFASTKKMVDHLDDFLYSKEFPVTSIHAGRDQKEREDALTAFRSNIKLIMVATDVLGRGMDIPNVSHVIQYDLPKGIDDYIHRIGRTARAGHEGKATSFYNDSNRDLAADITALLKDDEIPEFLQEFVSAETKEQRSHEELREEDLEGPLERERPAADTGESGGGDWAAEGNAGGGDWASSAAEPGEGGGGDWNGGGGGGGADGDDWNAGGDAGGDAGGW